MLPVLILHTVQQRCLTLMKQWRESPTCKTVHWTRQMLRLHTLQGSQAQARTQSTRLPLRTARVITQPCVCVCAAALFVESTIQTNPRMIRCILASTSVQWPPTQTVRRRKPEVHRGNSKHHV